MKLAASNIGWAPEHLDIMLDRLPSHGVRGLVVAPTMVWPEAPVVTAEQAREFRTRVEDHDLVIAGMQSLTYSLKDGGLSGDPDQMRNTSEHLKRMAELAGHLGATSLIFGSPNLRKGVERDQAIEVFAGVSQVAANNGAKFCIEPLSGYGNEFVTTAAEGVMLVTNMRDAGYGEGFGLHLDSAAIAGRPNPDPIRDIMLSHATVGIHSFDASAPDLLPVTGDETVNHVLMASALAVSGFDGFVSLEMRQPKDVDDPVAAYLREIDFVRLAYRG